MYPNTRSDKGSLTLLPYIRGGDKPKTGDKLLLYCTKKVESCVCWLMTIYLILKYTKNFVLYIYHRIC